MRYNVYSISSFKKSLRHLAKKYPHVKEDLEEVVQLLSQFPDIGTAIPGYSHKIWKVRAKCTDVRKGKRAGYRMMRSVCGRLRGPITILVSWVTVFVAHRTKEMRYYALGLGERLRGQGIPDA